MADEKDMKPSAADKQILAGADAPTPEKGGDKWLGRSILHKDHAVDLDKDSAVNEFGHKMPREEAEDEAYGSYLQEQHKQAAAHHLAGMKAAHAVDDMEAARKHGLMYKLHAQALGIEPVGPAHPDVIAAMGKKPSSYKFKSHKGDQFAVEDKKPEELGKSEGNHDPSEYSEWIESIKGPGHKCHSCHATVAEGSPGFNAQKPMPLHQHKPSCQYRQSKEVKKFDKSETATALNQLFALTEDILLKAEKKVPCICLAYSFPHRHRSGKCGKIPAKKK